MEHFYEKTSGENWFNYQDFYRFIVKWAPNNSNFVEVGSWKGRSTCFMGIEILNSGKNITFDCVDTWMTDTDAVIKNAYGTYSILQEFLNNITPIKSIIGIKQGISWEIAKNYEDASLDFVFIDASHDYESVKKDIEAWYPKVKDNGIISGHDYFNSKEFGGPYGVKQAIDEFFESKNIELMNPCWLHYKKVST